MYLLLKKRHEKYVKCVHKYLLVHLLNKHFMLQKKKRIREQKQFWRYKMFLFKDGMLRAVLNKKSKYER